MAQHLILPDPRRLPSRRASGAGGGGHQRQRGQHGRHLRQQLQQVVAAPSRLNAGVDPSAVFKIRAAARPDDSAFENRGLQVLGETVNYTYFVLTEDRAATLNRAIVRYTNSGALGSFFDLINDIEPYGAEDRRGPGIDQLVPPGTRVQPGATYTVDVGIWPSGDYNEAARRFAVVETVVNQTGGEILLRSVSARRTYLRVATTLDGVNDLLDTSVVELVRTPPVPFLDFRDWRDVSDGELDKAVTPSAVVGILDDSPADRHPLLEGLILSNESLAPSGYQWQQAGSHGTEVVGRALYADLHQELRDGRTVTAHGEVRVVRILEPDPGTLNGATRFPTYALAHELVEQGIRHLHSRYGVRIFNLSVGYAEPFDEVHVGPLTEIIDDLVRELDIVVVVPTGNAAIGRDARTLSGHHIHDDKPRFFLTAEHRLSEPGPAALAVSVGSLALSGAAAEMPRRVGWIAAAEANEASPFSRSGPGIGTASKRRNKPDVVHYGGNVVINDSGNAVENDPGASLVSTSFRHGDGRLFAAVNGTSFAVPAVARLAADIAEEYPESSANLIRALLVTGASPPAPSLRLTDAAERGRVYGLGLPARDIATTSSSTRVTMTYDGAMPIDTVQIHPLPVPELFRRGSGGERTITVALAFDPPVRRQRREYLAASMKVDIYRDMDPDQLAEMLVKQDPDDPNELISDRRRLTLLPGSNSFTNSTLQLRQWTARNSFINDDEVFYLVVTHRAQTWARNNPGYAEQKYALAVTLEDQHLVQADLHDLLTQRVSLPARVRVRA